MTDNELKALYPEIFIKFDTIFYDSKKYNLIDRFFHFSIESTDFTKRVNSMILKNNYEYTKNILHCYGFDITNEIELTIKKIKECYGLWNPKFHLESNRKLFLNDPNLLGISPFLFDQESWKKVMLNEIEKFKHEENHLNPVFWIIRDCLNETFERLGINAYSSKTVHPFPV